MFNPYFFFDNLTWADISPAKTYEKDRDDESEEADGRSEDLNDQDPHEERRVGRVRQSGAGTNLKDEKCLIRAVAVSWDEGHRHIPLNGLFIVLL